MQFLLGNAFFRSNDAFISQATMEVLQQADRLKRIRPVVKAFSHYAQIWMNPDPTISHVIQIRRNPLLNPAQGQSTLQGELAGPMRIHFLINGAPYHVIRDY